MHSTRSYLLALAGLALALTGTFAWKQYNELIALRASAHNSADVAAAQKRAWEAEQSARLLQSQLAAAEARAAETANRPAAAEPAAAIPAQAVSRQVTPEQLFSNPEYLTAEATLARAQIDTRYASLLRILNLAAEQADAFKSLLVDRLIALQDAQASAQEAGLDPSSAGQVYQQFLADTQKKYNDQIQATVGESVLAAVQQYDATTAQRSLVAQLQQQLAQSGATTLLTDTQTEALVNLLATENPAGNRGSNSTQITSAVLAQAQSVLSASQLQALQSLQQTQRAQQTVDTLLTQARLARN